jgi:hypothetical protein
MPACYKSDQEEKNCRHRYELMFTVCHKEVEGKKMVKQKDKLKVFKEPETCKRADRRMFFLAM